MNSINIKNAHSTKETTPFHIYKEDLSSALIDSGVYNSENFESLNGRISSMWNMGEPLWMAFEELKLRLRKMPKPVIKNIMDEIYPKPMSLAKRVVYMDWEREEEILRDNEELNYLSEDY